MTDIVKRDKLVDKIMIKNTFRFVLFACLPMTAYARGSLDISGWLYLSLGIVGVFLLYRFWMFVIALPAMIFYLIFRLLSKEVDEGVFIFSGVGFTITLAFSIAFLPKEYSSLPWYFIALICFGINIVIWSLIALLLERYRRSFESKND